MPTMQSNGVWVLGRKKRRGHSTGCGGFFLVTWGKVKGVAKKIDFSVLFSQHTNRHTKKMTHFQAPANEAFGAIKETVDCLGRFAENPNFHAHTGEGFSAGLMELHGDQVDALTGSYMTLAAAFDAMNEVVGRLGSFAETPQFLENTGDGFSAGLMELYITQVDAITTARMMCSIELGSTTPR